MERDCCFGTDPQLSALVTNLQPVRPQSVTPVLRPLTPSVKPVLPQPVREVSHE